ncbi:hypothetical protein [Polaromonas sp.]|uniref:hypothetical protein n=1 Tax=Polaromonas sp. TaxID=1869339 RepID=UPI002FC8AEA4
MSARPSLADDISAAFGRACRERDLEVAEHLFQALEAIAHRERDDSRLELAFGELLAALSARNVH